MRSLYLDVSPAAFSFLQLITVCLALYKLLSSSSVSSCSFPEARLVSSFCCRWSSTLVPQLFKSQSIYQVLCQSCRSIRHGALFYTSRGTSVRQLRNPHIPPSLLYAHHIRSPIAFRNPRPFLPSSTSGHLCPGQQPRPPCRYNRRPHRCRTLFRRRVRDRHAAPRDQPAEHKECRDLHQGRGAE